MDDRDELWRLLSEGLDLCVRARRIDKMYQQAITVGRSGTIPLWAQEQYEADLADWEKRTRGHLQANPSYAPSPTAQ